ncbi:hypothetical protein, partial [Xanthomonas perforans]
FEAAWQLSEQAKSLDPARHRSVLLAIRERADTILPRSVEFRNWCDEILEKLISKRAPGLRFW